MNLLVQDVEIVGNITFKDGLTIEGRVEGEITSPGDLTIGEHALIKGDIKTRSVIVHGRVEGNITVQERCDARATSVIVGDITAGTFAVAEGATFSGRSRVGKAAVAAAAAASSPPAAPASPKA
ncbi:MAG: polymer-forming cytoskeletal [Verrucomicrobiaceae bacterium]|nr:polymer-forming cytoskeletal [Verrucomicrobiaceae bacterium]